LIFSFSFSFPLFVVTQESTVFNLAHAYRKERFLEHAIVCLERCLALKESSSAYSALAFCLHLQAMTLPLTRRDETNTLLHQAIDTYHQSLAKKPDDAFSSEMLAKALGDALEQTDFFVASEIDVASKNSGGVILRGNQSSIWTDDGLSLSVESASDMEMA
jgi:tetratricopeptide (TPR) repeat protein